MLTTERRLADALTSLTRANLDLQRALAKVDSATKDCERVVAITKRMLSDLGV